ncbi:MAG: hypothetical protein J5780_06185 [Treponema sp.]|nr:hypothetical protein [Treponema sp.]
MLKKLFSLIALFGTFAFTACFDIEQSYSIVNGNYVYNAVIGFNKSALVLADMTTDDLREQIMTGETYEELQQKFDDISVTEDEKKSYISVTETLKDESPEKPEVTDEKIYLQFNNDSTSQNILDVKQSMDTDPDYKAMADLIFADSNWCINISKTITETVSSAKLVDDNGNSIDVAFEEKENCFTVSFPILTIFNSEFQIKGVEIYR